MELISPELFTFTAIGSTDLGKHYEFRCCCDVGDIQSIEQYLDQEGKPVEDRCLLQLSTRVYIVKTNFQSAIITWNQALQNERLGAMIQPE